MLASIENLPLAWIVGLFVLSGILIAVMGTWLSGLVDQLADRTSLGEAMAGGILLGATTSLPDIVVSVSAAAKGYPEIAVSNALGGIAAQTAFLVIADLTYRRANLEHAAASATNMLSATLLLLLLTLPLIAANAPELSLAGVHPLTPVAFLAYIGFQRVLARDRNRPAWRPAQTAETVTDQPDPRSDHSSLRSLWLRFGIAAIAVAGAGFVIAESGIALANKTGLSESLIGVLFTSVSTSAAELVTSIAAVRRGALTLAVSGIIGGNAFDALLVPMSDLAYRGGSIYHAISRESMFLAAGALAMTIVLLMGLLRREKSGIGNIGLEGWLVLSLYFGLVTTLYFM